MLWWGKKSLPEPTPELKKFRSELRRYVQKYYEPPKRPEPEEDRQSSHTPSVKEPEHGHVMHSFRMDDDPFEDDPDLVELMKRADKDPSVLQSSTMRSFYLAWERRNGVKVSFSSEVVRLVSLKYKKPSAFYVPAGIDKRIYHKMKTDYEYKPSKNTAIRCCLGLHMDDEEAADLLKLAGYAFSPSDPSDLIVRFCLEKGIWDINSVNYLMDSFDVKDLEGYTSA